MQKEIETKVLAAVNLKLTPNILPLFPMGWDWRKRNAVTPIKN